MERTVTEGGERPIEVQDIIVCWAIRNTLQMGNF